MAKVYFYYAAMNAGKSTVLLQAGHNYRERGLRPLLLVPAIDDRAGAGRIHSRIGLAADARPIQPGDDLLAVIGGEHQQSPVACVLVDEAQFLSPAQVWQLTDVADHLGVPVLCYGLRTDFLGRLFEGSAQLLAWADNLVELKTVCHCGAKATMVVRVRGDGRVETSGAQVEIGGNDRYVPLCRKHFRAALMTGTA